MPIEYLALLSYATAICFMMSLTIGLAVVAILRRQHLDKQQVTVALQSQPKKILQIVQQVPAALDNTQTWHGKQQFSTIRETATITQVPTELPAVPLRYQQTLLYNDDTYNPCNDLETQPEKPPRQPAITGSA